MAYVFLNGEMVEEGSARIASSDRGLLLGDGLFETMRAYGGCVFRLAAHLARLRDSAAFFRLRVPCDDAAVEGAISELVRRNGCPDAYVRLTLTRGVAPGLRMDVDAAPTVLIQVRALAAYPAHLYRHGAKLIVSKFRQNSASPLPRHKTLNYLLYLLARQEATDAGANGALLLNENGHVTEESVSNLFLVRADRLLTPPVYCGLLPGIVRGVILEIAADEGILVEERPIRAGEVFECDEMFLTNSLMEVMPVSSVDKRPLRVRAPGPMTIRIRESYRALVEKETG